MTALASDYAQNSEQKGSLPFQPLFTIKRSGRVEVVVYGIVSVVAGPDKSLIATGDTHYELWSRSLLKPWQLLTNFEILKKNYPALKDEHFALFMASHSGESEHLQALEEIFAICGVQESALLCPPARPVDSQTRTLMKERGEKSQRRYHNCSGKHSGYLAAIKASGGSSQDLASYLVESQPQHSRLKQILSYLTGRTTDTFTATTDGCQLPNYALSTSEMALMYMSLLNQQSLPQTAKEQAIFEPYDQIGALMLKYPRMISGQGRLDYKIMSREVFGDAPPMVAKEGADGLLGIGVAATEQYPQGIGITIKLSAGFDSHHMEIISREILGALGLITPQAKSENRHPEPGETLTIRTDHIKSEFHFLDGLER